MGRAKLPPEERYLRALDGRGYSPETLRVYTLFYADLRARAECGPKRWTVEDLEDWMSYLRHERGNRPKTVAVKLSAVAGLCRWMVGEGLRETDPTAGLTRPRRERGLPRPAPTAVVEGLLADEGAPVRASAALGAYAGLRRAEMCALRWHDLTDTLLFVRHGKGGHARAVPVHPQLAFVLRGLDQGTDAVVTDSLGRGYSPDGLSNRVRPVMRRLGMPAGESLHTLRHWFVTGALDGGANAYAVMRAAGHVSVSTTQTYAAVSDQAVRDAVLGISS